MKDEITRRLFLGGSLAAGVGIAASATTAWARVASDAKRRRLLHTIDCTQDYPPERYFAHGETAVRQSPAGRYREAEGKPKARFGYRFALANVERPHLAVVHYPDDKRRFMCIMDGTSYDLTTGVFTGWAQPISDTMQELQQVFWPRWKDASIVLMTWSTGEPAAAARIEIWELDDLPPVRIHDLGLPNRRELGIQYEDPVGACATEGATNRQEWTDHLVQYARHTGQRLLTYPLAWYHGPLFPSKREPAGSLGIAIAPDRNMYLRWTTQPADWYAALLDRFGREGLRYQGSLTLMRLGSLLQTMNIDLASIQAGKDTYNNMLWNDQVQASTNDWTPIYNARNLDAISTLLEKQPFIEPYGGNLPPLVYGEQRNSANHTGPMFNPLHPVVQRAIVGFVGEIGSRYAKYPAFQGIAFNMFAACMPWYGSIHFGYDDYSIGLFERETGIHVPVDPKAANRFSRRYEYLTYVCRPAWIAWRCRKIRQLFGRIHAELRATRPDLRVTITLWDETVVTNVLGQAAPALQLHARKSMLQLYREAGIDPALYGNEPGLEIDLGIGNSRDRGGHGPKPTGGVTLRPEHASMYRDFNFLDQECLDAIDALPQPGAFIFNNWVEAWGKHIWFRPDDDDANLERFSTMDGQRVEGILRINSEYPEDDFWWQSQMRVTPAFPGGVHFMEPYVHAIAQFDATRITRGGLFLDKAHSEPIRRFARAYCGLPRKKFATVGNTTDPVAVRTLLEDGKRYLYAVNRDYYKVGLTVSFGGDPPAVYDLGSGATLPAAQAWPLVLGPYELCSFVLPADATVTGFEASPPAAIVAALTAEARTAQAAFEAVRKAGKFVPGMDRLASGMHVALAEGRLAWLRRALTSYIVRKCRLLAAEP